MKIFGVIVCVLALSAISYADTSVGNYSDPNRPGKCVLAEDIILSPGTHQNPWRCGEVSCGVDGWAEFRGCGVSVIEIPGCTAVDVDQSLDYPECCKKRLICPNQPEFHNRLF